MNKTMYRIGKSIRLFSVSAILFSSTALFAYASFTIGKSSVPKSNTGFLSNKTNLTPTKFSLNSGYSFRGNNIFTKTETSYFNLNTTMVIQSGKTTILLPVNKKVPFNGKVTFNLGSPRR